MKTNILSTTLRVARLVILLGAVAATPLALVGCEFHDLGHGGGHGNGHDNHGRGDGHDNDHRGDHHDDRDNDRRR